MSKLSKNLRDIEKIIENSHDMNDNMAELGIFGDFYTRLKDSLISGNIFKNIADWICNNTMLAGKPWSFFEHEFQKDIAGDPAQDGCIKKCSQVGLTELAVRMALAWLAISDGRSLIYVLPTSKFAGKFTKSRIDPIVESSPKLKALMVAAANSSDLKRISNSFLYINGAADESQAISIPAQGLFVDERDKCSNAVLSVYDSRSRHARDEKYQRSWSTPTAEGYGIDADYARSSRKRYLCKCKHCEQWVCPDFARDVVIPGFNEDFINFDKMDVTNEDIKINAAYIACFNCRKPLDASLADASRREWVAEYPDISYVGWGIQPFDLISHNATVSILQQRGKYSRTQEYQNFVLGNAYTSKNSRIDMQTLQRLTQMIEQMQASGVCVGIDVGKTCHVIIGKKIGKIYNVIRIMRVKQSDDVNGTLFLQIKKICMDYKATCIVIDSGPDFTLVRELRGYFIDRVFPCIYARDNPRMPNYFEVSQVEKTKGSITCQRTKGLDTLVEEFNAEQFLLPRSPELEEFKKHLTGMKRVDYEDEESGLIVQEWNKTGPDHYFHALLYFKLACDVLNSDAMGDVVPASPAVTGVVIGGKKPAIATPQNQSSIRHLMGIMGIR